MMPQPRLSDVAAAQLKALRADAQRELVENILPFSMQRVMDRERGGFYGYVANDGTAQKDAPKALIQHSRMLWTFVHAGRTLDSSEYSSAAQHARDSVMKWFWDLQLGGCFWMVDSSGKPLRNEKLTYGQAFAIYALAEDHLAGGQPRSHMRASELFRLIESNCRDSLYGGYWEACRRDWMPAPELRVDETALPVAKGMNTHLHLLEAYTNLLHAWDHDEVRESLRSLIRLMLGRILQAGTRHLCLFFDRAWRPLSQAVSYGHDIEASWLLTEAAEALDDNHLWEEARQGTLQLAYATLEQGVGPDGGLFSDGDASGVTKRTREWWPQAEAVVGFLNAFELSSDTRFLDASLASWRFIQEHIVDKVNGDWLWGVDDVGRPLQREKAGPWKAAYHSGRTCMEVMRRVQRLTS